MTVLQSPSFHMVFSRIFMHNPLLIILKSKKFVFLCLFFFLISFFFMLFLTFQLFYSSQLCRTNNFSLSISSFPINFKHYFGLFIFLSILLFIIILLLSLPLPSHYFPLLLFSTFPCLSLSFLASADH